MTRFSRLIVVLALSIASAEAPAAGQSPINQRSTSARATIGGSPRDRDGSFQATGVSGVCGEIPKEASLTGQAVFVIEFPSDPAAGTITAIAFGSNQLVLGVTKATVFRLMVGVLTAKGGKPPNYVLNTDSSRPGNAGTATLTNVKGETTLNVTGQNDMRETIDLTVTCR
jgi:hypothetical protein